AWRSRRHLPACPCAFSNVPGHRCTHRCFFHCTASPGRWPQPKKPRPPVSRPGHWPNCFTNNIMALWVHLHCPQASQGELHALALHLLHYTPNVLPPEPHGVSLEIQESLHLFGGALALLHRL